MHNRLRKKSQNYRQRVGDTLEAPICDANYTEEGPPSSVDLYLGDVHDQRGCIDYDRYVQNKKYRNYPGIPDRREAHCFCDPDLIRN